MRTSKLNPILVLVTGLACVATLVGCPRQGEGPAERAGKAVDKGVGAVGEGIEKTGDAIEDTAEGRR